MNYQPSGISRRDITRSPSPADGTSACNRLGRLGNNDLVFARANASPHTSDNLSRDWRRTVLSLKHPRVSFHALRHSHVSALIAVGLDVVMISRRIGHVHPAVTLAVYAHVFAGANKDAAAAAAIEAAMGATR